jgi:hypothetical protein
MAALGPCWALQEGRQAGCLRALWVCCSLSQTSMLHPLPLTLWLPVAPGGEGGWSGRQAGGLAGQKGGISGNCVGEVHC